MCRVRSERVEFGVEARALELAARWPRWRESLPGKGKKEEMKESMKRKGKEGKEREGRKEERKRGGWKGKREKGRERDKEEEKEKERKERKEKKQAFSEAPKLCLGFGPSQFSFSNPSCNPSWRGIWMRAPQVWRGWACSKAREARAGRSDLFGQSVSSRQEKQATHDSLLAFFSLANDFDLLQVVVLAPLWQWLTRGQRCMFQRPARRCLQEADKVWQTRDHTTSHHCAMTALIQVPEQNRCPD